MVDLSKGRSDKALKEKGIEFEDFGTYSIDSCDYPDIAYTSCRS